MPAKAGIHGRRHGEQAVKSANRRRAFTLAAIAHALPVVDAGLRRHDACWRLSSMPLAVIGFAWNVALVLFGVAITEWLWGLF